MRHFKSAEIPKLRKHGETLKRFGRAYKEQNVSGKVGRLYLDEEVIMN